MNIIVMKKGKNFGSSLKHSNYPLVWIGAGALPLPMPAQLEREIAANTIIVDTNIFFMGYLTFSEMMVTQNSFWKNTIEHP